MKTVKVIINKDGSKIEMEVNGVSGASCTDITSRLRAAIGVAEDSKLKNEYYESVATDVVIHG